MGIGTKIAKREAAKIAAEAAAKKAASFAVKPEMAVAEKAPLAVKPIATYHASPHLFDKFDDAFIGTGEGAQSYGVGHYFAENPAVSGRGGQYDLQFTRMLVQKDKSSELDDRMNRLTVGGKPLGKTYDIGPDYEIIEHVKSGDVARVLDYVQKRKDRWHDLSIDPKYQSKDYAAERLAGYHRLQNDLHGGAELHYPMRANIYETNINADPAQFLDWDKPLSAQPDIYQKVLADRGWRRRLQFRTDEGVGEMKGSDLYGMGHDQTRNLGVPGIRYLDEGSRGVGKGTSNYVVFDPNLLEIKRRYAKGGATNKAHGGRVSPLAVKRK